MLTHSPFLMAFVEIFYRIFVDIYIVDAEREPLLCGHNSLQVFDIGNNEIKLRMGRTRMEFEVFCMNGEVI